MIDLIAAIYTTWPASANFKIEHCAGIAEFMGSPPADA